MSGKTVTAGLALAAGLLTLTSPAAAHDDKIVAQLGGAAAAATSVDHNEGGSGVEVHRGPAKLLPRAAASLPAAYISGERVKFDRLEPTTNWFVDRSGDRLVVVHCYAQQSAYVGGGKKIRCSARKL